MDRQAARLVTIGLEGHALTREAAELLQGGVRSVILFTRNFRDATQLRELTRSIRQAAGAPVLVSVDQEGGRVQRFRGPEFPDLPSARQAAAAGEDAVRRSAVAAARCLRAVGIHMNLAPVLDVDSNPANPVIADRAFGVEPTAVAAFGAAYAESLQAEGVAACGKHFPGHGDTSVDSHLDLPRLPHAMSRLERIELVPFRAAVASGIASLMTAHVLFEAIDPEVPATLSRRVVTGLLRERLGFEGLVFTDDFEMQAIADRFELGEAAVRAVEAGCDQVLVCHRIDRQRRTIEALSEAIRSGRLPPEQVDRSLNRLRSVLDSFVFGLE